MTSTASPLKTSLEADTLAHRRFTLLVACVSFSALLLEHGQKPMAEQQGIIMQAFYDYQGKQRRRDDVSLLGFSV